MKDSLGNPDPHPYGLINWNGHEWKVKKIIAKNPSGGNSYIIPTGIVAIDQLNIWLVRGGVFLFNGDSIKNTYWLLNYSGYNGGIFNNGEIPKRIWGDSSKNLFVCRDKGALAFYNGSSWQRINTGTDLDINDIWGQKNNSGEYEILCIASDKFTNKGRRIFRIQNKEVTSLNEDGLSNSLNTIWFIHDKKYYIGGDGLFSNYSLHTNWIRNNDLPAYYKTCIRGNDINDIIVSGAFGLLLHYNGESWINFQNITYINGAFSKVDFKGNLLCAVGSNDNQAIIVMGKR